MGAFEERVLLSTFNWTAGVNGNFNVAANWTAQPGNIHGVPGPNDTAANNTNCDITVDNSASVGAWVDGVDNGAGELILNTGVTLTITGGSGNTALNSTIEFPQVPSGATLQVNGGTTALGALTSAGTLNVAGGAVVQFGVGGQPANLNAGTALTGAGLYQVHGLTVNVNASLTTSTDFEINGGTVDLAPGVALTFASGGTFSMGSNAFDTSLVGPTAPGAGYMASVVIDTGANLNIGNASGSYPVRLEDNIALTNDGTATWSGNSDFFYVDSPAVFNNNGTLTSLNSTTTNQVLGLRCDVDVGAVNNAGTWINDGTATTLIDVPFNNSGTVEVQNGTFQLNQWGSSTGTFIAAEGTTVAFTGGSDPSYKIEPNSSLTSGQYLDGAGTYEVGTPAGSLGTLQVNASISVEDLQLEEEGALQMGSGSSLTIPKGAGDVLNLSGALSCTGTKRAQVTVAAGATLDVNANARIFDDVTLTNAGSGYYLGGQLWVTRTNTTFVPQFKNTGVFTIESAGGISAQIGPGQVRNIGTWIMNSAADTDKFVVADSFSNTGKVEVQSGSLKLSEGVVQLSDGTLSAGSWTVANLSGDSAELEFGGNGVFTIGSKAKV
ncbi:MAG TPA: hypothetical protein VFA18_13990, partial [Gemmataceae bacterium]|nr:hypothetical protein [Gemmataceae bacterium]